MSAFAPLDRVVDSTLAPDDRREMVVLWNWLRPANQVDIDALGCTLAEAAPEFPADDNAVHVAFANDLDEVFGDRWWGWESWTLIGQVPAHGIRAYTYHECRLATADDAPDDCGCEHATIDADGGRP